MLGKSPSWQDAEWACSGYLIEEDGFHLLLDCGNGVFSKLRRFIDYVDVDAVVISHLHADHFLDLVPFSYALTYAPRQQPVPVDRWPGTDSPACPALHVPPGATELFRRVVGAWGNEDLIENAFAMREYDPPTLEVARCASLRPVPPSPDHRVESPLQRLLTLTSPDQRRPVSVDFARDPTCSDPRRRCRARREGPRATYPRRGRLSLAPGGARRSC